MKKCYLYTRVSSSNQAASDRDGIPRQRDACVTIAKEKGFTVEAEFSDSITGDAAWNQRPGFLDMVGAILDNGVRAVVELDAGKVPLIRCVHVLPPGSIR